MRLISLLTILLISSNSLANLEISKVTAMPLMLETRDDIRKMASLRFCVTDGENVVEEIGSFTNISLFNEESGLGSMKNDIEVLNGCVNVVLPIVNQRMNMDKENRLNTYTLSVTLDEETITKTVCLDPESESGWGFNLEPKNDICYSWIY